MPHLFSYGTLQQRDVQLANFGRALAGVPDSLTGYILDQVQITDPRVLRESGQAYHPILRYTGHPTDEISGTVFELTEAELAQADDYEVDDYVRVAVTTKSGHPCWAYAARQEGIPK